MPLQGRLKPRVLKDLYVDVLHTTRCRESHPPTHFAKSFATFTARQIGRVTCVSRYRRMPDVWNTQYLLQYSPEQGKMFARYEGPGINWPLTWAG